MKKVFTLLFIALSCFQHASAQSKTYRDSILAYQKNYVATHEVVGKADKKYIRFFDVDKSYRVPASFEKINDGVGFDMFTSSGVKQKYYKYSHVTFKLRDSLIHYMFTSRML